MAEQTTPTQTGGAQDDVLAAASQLHDLWVSIMDDTQWQWLVGGLLMTGLLAALVGVSRRRGRVDPGASEPDTGAAAPDTTLDDPVSDQLRALMERTDKLFGKVSTVMDLLLTADSNRAQDQREARTAAGNLLDKIKEMWNLVERVEGRVQDIKDPAAAIQKMDAQLAALHKGVKADLLAVKTDLGTTTAGLEVLKSQTAVLCASMESLQQKFGVVTAVVDGLTTDLAKLWEGCDTAAARESHENIAHIKKVLAQVCDVTWALQESQTKQSEQIQALLDKCEDGPAQAAGPAPRPSGPVLYRSPPQTQPGAGAGGPGPAQPPIINLSDTVAMPTPSYRGGAALVVLPGGGQMTLDAAALTRLVVPS